jgi:hypothetical protein
MKLQRHRGHKRTLVLMAQETGAILQAMWCDSLAVGESGANSLKGGRAARDVIKETAG